ncbi:MAG: RluA family pseudouridine synthase [Parachlamydiales bacterium]|nr:RluA family pseudouridine synthase [Parachlamydiales bacterium]
MTDNFLITDNIELTRIDKLISKQFEAKSRTYFQYLIENGCVLVNSKKVKKSFIPKINDEIEIYFQALPDIDLKAEDIPLDILYEDDDILAINKPAGMVVHPGAGNWSNTFVNALLFYCKDLIRKSDDIRPGIVHRLDKDTSGVLLAAKTQKAHQKLIEQFKNRKIFKKYLAICLNKPQDQEISIPIARHPVNRKKMAVNENGKEAITQIKTLQYNEKFSLLEVFIKTGRTHQIRVHLKHLNCPILGDEVYGNKSINSHFKINRQLLHAQILELTHPITDKPLKIEAPLPEDFKKFKKMF